MTVRFLLTALPFLIASVADASVIFSEFTIDQVSTPVQLGVGAGEASTDGIPGVAADPAAAGDIFAIHRNDSGTRSYLRVNPATGTAEEIINSAEIGQQIGSPTSMTGGFAYYATSNTLYVSEQSIALNAAPILALNADTGAVEAAFNDSAMSMIGDIDVLPGGQVAGVLRQHGDVGTIDPATGAWTTRISDADFLAAATGLTTVEFPTLGISQASGTAFFFSSNQPALFSSSNLTGPAPTVVQHTENVISSAAIRDMAVDQYNNMYGLDTVNNNLVIIRGPDREVFVFPLSEVASVLQQGALEPVEFRGVAARVSVNPYQTDVFLASDNANYGIVRVRFGTSASAVKDWSMY